MAFYDLAKEARDDDLFRLVLVINSENAVKALKLMNGGNMFRFVKGPKVNREAVKNSYGEEFAKIFDDCNGCIGLAVEYVMDNKKKELSKEMMMMTAREFTEMKNRAYLQNACLVEQITLEEYTKAQVKVDK